MNEPGEPKALHLQTVRKIDEGMDECFGNLKKSRYT